MGDIHASTGLYCIFGDPVSHSLSPAMQNAAFRDRGIDAVYLAFRPSSISAALDAMRALPILGASVTIPFKSDILPLLDDADPLAADIGAVNTAVNRDGRIIGYNTDGLGALEALRRAGARPGGKRVLVLGNGGSARAVAFTLLAEGCAIIIAGRNPGRYMPLVEDLRRKDPTVGHAVINKLTPSLMEAVDIIINTTSVGMAPDTGSSPLPVEFLAPHHTVFDIVYTPRETALLTMARERGCRLVYGSEMLLYQGARQFELWTGKEAPLEAMRRPLEAMRRALEDGAGR